MADIELVIKIPEKEYENICLMSKDGIGMALYDWIANGTPLPKGHGNLYDERDLEKLGKVYFQEEVVTNDSNIVFRFPKLIISATPIIEAEKFYIGEGDTE